MPPRIFEPEPSLALLLAPSFDNITYDVIDDVHVLSRGGSWYSYISELRLITCPARTSHRIGMNCFRSSSHFVSMSMALFWSVIISIIIISSNISSNSIDVSRGTQIKQIKNWRCPHRHCMRPSFPLPRVLGADSKVGLIMARRPSAQSAPAALDPPECRP